MKRLADQTFYEILEIPADASAEQIQAAYERARALYGPGSLVTYTLMEPDEAALLEARIEDARGTLLDPERRARYDEGLDQRHAEARASAVAGGGAAPAVPPPVIPALQASAPAPREPAPPVDEPAVAHPALLLGAAGAVHPDGDEPRPAPRPILLQREVGPGAVAAPVEAPVPAQVEARDSAPGVAPTAAAPATPPGGPVAAPPSAAAPPAPPPLPDAWTGEALRQVREARGLSTQQIAERTKVTRHHIENIEADRFAALPAQVYLRGILLAIARELRLDGQKVARSYVERLGGSPAGAAPKPR